MQQSCLRIATGHAICAHELVLKFCTWSTIILTWEIILQPSKQYSPWLLGFDELDKIDWNVLIVATEIGSKECVHTHIKGTIQRSDSV